MKIFSQILTYIFHPSLVITYCLSVFLFIYPEAFGVDRFFLQTPFLFMRQLKLVGSMSLLTAKERVGPYIIGMVFYIWYYFTIRSNFEIPALFKSLVLGSAITLAILFFFNNFSKISAHMAGMAGLTFFALVFIFLSIVD